MTTLEAKRDVERPIRMRCSCPSLVDRSGGIEIRYRRTSPDCELHGQDETERLMDPPTEVTL